MLSNLYGNSVHLNPAYQWIDDLEVWDLPPCAALPCGAPSGVTPSSVTTCPPPVMSAFTGCYYSDVNLTTLGMVRIDPNILFNWGIGSPDLRIPTEHFSVRWNGIFNFDARAYTFTATADDGFRLYIDDVLVMDHWADQQGTTYNQTLPMTSGAHTIRFEYFENVGIAAVSLHW